MVAVLPIEGAFFGGAGDSRRGDGEDVDVGEGTVGVFGDGEGYGGHGDGFAEEPGDALLEGRGGGVSGTGVVGGGLLRLGIGEGGDWGGRKEREVPFGGYSRCRRRGSCSGFL